MLSKFSFTWDSVLCNELRILRSTSTGISPHYHWKGRGRGGTNINERFDRRKHLLSLVYINVVNRLINVNQSLVIHKVSLIAYIAIDLSYIEIS